MLDDVLKLLNIKLDDHEEDTVGGYIFGLLGRQPNKGDAVVIGEYKFKVLKTEGFRIIRVLASTASSAMLEPQNSDRGSALS